MILHTVNTSPTQHRSLQTCLQFMGDSDALLLLEDGVYGALRDVSCGLEPIKCPVYVITADVKARGLVARLRDDVKVIDYDEFVSLCVESNAVKSW